MAIFNINGNINGVCELVNTEWNEPVYSIEIDIDIAIAIP